MLVIWVPQTACENFKLGDASSPSAASAAASSLHLPAEDVTDHWCMLVPILYGRTTLGTGRWRVPKG
eukprot:m.199559 g.199559  ORF g.199559 m.199559 type:complete len:67 (-) comp20774_c0_seq1:1213-1413(-)